MPLFLRLIALLLLLTTGGVSQTLALVGDGVEDCAGEEEDGGPCADCAGDCGVCPCCPLRAIPTTSVVEMIAEASPPEPVLVSLAEPVLFAVGTDIFQPPRA